MVNGMLRLLRVIRPHIVVGGFLGYIAGAFYALNTGGSINLSGFIAGYLVVFFMDLSTHFNNDYFDIDVDRNAPFKPFGNRNIFLEHPELMRSSLIASITSTAISLILAALLVKSTSWDIVAVALLFNLLGWLYSAPPVRLHSRRLGEITIAIGTGFCVPAIGYIIASGGLTKPFTPFMIPLVLYGFNLSLCLQVPDYEVDLAMEKKTIVGLIGRRKTYYLVALCSLVASASYFILFRDWVPWLSLIPLASSLLCLTYSDSPEDAKKHIKLNISALFIFLAGLDLLLLLNMS